MLRCKCIASVASLLLVLSAVPALANSTSFSISGTLTSLNGLSHQQVNGSVMWSSVLGATSSLLNLSNTTGPASCSSSCTLLLATFAGTGRWAGDTEYLSGLLTPTLVLTIFNSSGNLIATYTGNMTWAVPESGSPLELILVLVVLVIAFFKSPLLRHSSSQLT
jgi:hypothetical protein